MPTAVCKRVDVLHPTGNFVRAQGAEALAPSVAQLSQLKVFDLAGTSLWWCSLVWPLLLFITERHAPVPVLGGWLWCLAGNFISWGAQALAPSLAKLTQLHTLNLHGA